MKRSLQKMKRTIRDLKKRGTVEIPAAWRERFKLLPGGYSPIKSRGAGDWFDAAAADDVIAFFAECIKHVKGPKAGQPFVLEPWQAAVTGCLFGWKRQDGTRRYRECLIYVAKKNGKTAWVAGILLYLLVADNEPSPELYSAAASREQAGLIFQHAAGMVRQEPVLRRRLKVLGAGGGGVTKSIVWEEAFGSYKCLAADADTADGVNPSGNAIDELHRHKKPELAQVLVKSTAARSQPLTLYTTTADYDRPSLCNTTLAYARAVVSNGGDRGKPGYDPAFLPVIYEASPDDDWTDPKVWRKANPNLGVTFPEAFLAREVRKAQDSPTELNNLKRLHLNIVTQINVAWLRMEKWDACPQYAIDLDQLKEAKCWAGLDMSATTDLTALSLLFPVEGAMQALLAEAPCTRRRPGKKASELPAYLLVPVFWVPEATARIRQEQDKVPYETWIQQGYIRATPGEVVDYDIVRRDVGQISELIDVQEVAIDRWNSTQLQTQLMGDGLDVVPYGQGFASMSAPTKEFERLTIEGELSHGAHPVLRWQAAHVSVLQDAAGNVKPDKAKSTDRIDGIVAGIMALGRAMVRVKKDSVYKTRGLQSL